MTAVSKTEATIADHPGLTLDDLVTKKKINADQKAQILKKPQLEAQLAQLEEQQKNFNEFAADFDVRMNKQKSSLTEAHEAEIEKLKEQAAKAAIKDSEKKVHEALKVVIQFLHAAAYKRTQEDVDPEESRSYEALLFHIYQGNHTALNALENLITGKDEKTTEPSGEDIDYTFAQLKESAMSVLTDDALEAHDTVAEPTDPPGTDPTVANAGLTELEDTATIPTSTTEETSPDDIASAAPEQSTITEASNAVGDAWNPEASSTTQSAEDWVQVPRDPAETETGSAAPAIQQSTSNWADEAGAAAEETTSPAPTGENDGFSEVKRERGGRGRGGTRGARGNQDGRGRGRGRGEYRGRSNRARGGPRGGTDRPTT